MIHEAIDAGQYVLGHQVTGFLAQVAVAGFAWAWTYLATVDWLHPTTHTRRSSR